MIYLDINTTNTVIMTLNEKTTLPLTGVTYLMEIYSDSNHSADVLVLSGDTSSNPNRYNSFDITLPTDIDLQVGQYDYFVWQSSGSTQLSGATSIVESGKMTVFGEVETPTVYNNDKDEHTFE